MSDIQDLPPAPATSRRTAWLIVIIMSTLFLLALAGVIFGFVRQSRIFLAARRQAPSAAGPAAGGPEPAAVVQLASGAHIVSASTEAGKLVLHVATPSGGEVEVIDLATGRLTAQVRTAP